MNYPATVPLIDFSHPSEILSTNQICLEYKELNVTSYFRWLQKSVCRNSFYVSIFVLNPAFTFNRGERVLPYLSILGKISFTGYGTQY